MAQLTGRAAARHRAFELRLRQLPSPSLGSRRAHPPERRVRCRSDHRTRCRNRRSRELWRQCVRERKYAASRVFGARSHAVSPLDRGRLDLRHQASRLPAFLRHQHRHSTDPHAWPLPGRGPAAGPRRNRALSDGHESRGSVRSGVDDSGCAAPDGWRARSPSRPWGAETCTGSGLFQRTSPIDCGISANFG